MKRLAVAAAVGSLAVSLCARAETRFNARLEVGAEYDSNAGRIEEVKGAPPTLPIVASPLGRLVASGDVALSPRQRHTLALSASLAVKRFVDEGARGEDVLVGQASGSWTVPLASRTGLGLAAAYYDVYQRASIDPRDFRSLTPTLRLEQGLGAAGLLSAGGGYRVFTYKPYRNFDFTGPTAFIAYRHLFAGASNVGADWELAGGANLELRGFAGTRCLGVDLCPGPADAGRRRDQFWLLHAEATRTGDFLVGFGAAVHGNVSNSYGDPLLRGVFHGRAVFLLPWEVALSTRAELVATRYYDPLPLSRDLTGTPLVSIEDEGRSMLRLEIARPVGRRLDAGVRYTFYTNEVTGGPVRFRRHTALVFLALLLDA